MATQSDFAARWAKRLRENVRPAYAVIAELIAEDMKSGRLAGGDRLPPLRRLSDDLGLNYTTVARGYGEARRRGLIEAHAGRGTFIRSAIPPRPLRSGGWVEMTMNLPPEPRDPALLRRLQDGFATLARRGDPHALLRYQDFGGAPEDRDAGARWLRRLLPGATADRVLVCPGIQSTLVALITMLAAPGEAICAEAITYPGLKAITAQLGVRVHPLPLDAEGIDVHAFEAACRELRPKALYCNPTLQNPTTMTISPARRAAIADIALRYSVPIIEDDPYGVLPSVSPTPIAAMAPELTYYLTGLAKCVGAGLRIAYLAAPDVRQTHRAASALRSMTVMASPLGTALATHWIDTELADAMLCAIRKESVERQKLAAKLLPAGTYRTHPEAFHIWLSLPERWNRVEFASHLGARGVGVVASHAFCIDTRNPPEAVRICLGGPLDRDGCRHALELIHDTLAQSPALVSTAI
jgi:DNA-binding transcriptional MocR family regulator